MSLENMEREEFLKYPIEIFWSNEDECFIANVPDIKYCSAHGETQEDALQEVKIALQEVLRVMKEKNMPIPPPSQK